MLVIRPRGGLCNYLRHVFGWYSYARSINSQLVVVWEETCHCNGFFLDYFEEIDGITFLRDNSENYEFASNGWHGPPSSDYKALGYKSLKLRKDMLKIIKRRIKKLNGKNKGCVDVGRKDVNGKGVKQKKIITSGLERKKIIIKVKNSKNGKNGKNGNRLKKVKKVKKLKNKYNSVHIRRTDHIGFAISRNAFTTDDEFNTFIKNNKNNKNLYIATDDPKTYKVFRKRYRKNVKLKYHETNPTAYRKTSLRDAIIDIYMSVYADEFMGSGASSFSELITTLRDIKKS